jgi:Phage integrase SAM-like domain
MIADRAEGTTDDERSETKARRPKRHRNAGLRKLCDCSRRNWPKCAHSWYFNFKPRGGKAWRFSLDAEVGKHVASKTDAEKIAGDIRTAINAGTYIRAADRRIMVAAAPAPTADAMMLDAFAEKYVENRSKASGKKSWKNDRHMLARLGAFVLADGVRLGGKAIGAITEDDLEAFYAGLRTKGRAASTCNQYVQVLRSAFKWATKKGYVARNPITEDAALERTKIAQRSRRLAPDVLDKDGKVKTPGEERRLLAVARPELQRLIVAALETGCRRGELLNAGRMGLHDSMQRFEGFRCNPVAKNAETEHPLTGNDGGEDGGQVTVN